MTRYLPHALGLGLILSDAARDINCAVAAICFVLVVVSHVIAEFRVRTLKDQLAEAARNRGIEIAKTIQREIRRGTVRI